MRTRPPKTKRTDTLLPDTTLLRSSFAARPNSPLGSGALLRLARIRAEILLELALHVPVLVGIRRLRPLAGYVRPLRRIVPVQLEPRLGPAEIGRAHV